MPKGAFFVFFRYKGSKCMLLYIFSGSCMTLAWFAERLSLIKIVSKWSESYRGIDILAK